LLSAAFRRIIGRKPHEAACRSPNDGTVIDEKTGQPKAVAAPRRATVEETFHG